MKYSVRFAFNSLSYPDIIKSVTRVPQVGEHVTFDPSDSVSHPNHRTFRVIRVECEYDFLDDNERFIILIN